MNEQQIMAAASCHGYQAIPVEARAKGVWAMNYQIKQWLPQMLCCLPAIILLATGGEGLCHCSSRGRGSTRSGFACGHGTRLPAAHGLL